MPTYKYIAINESGKKVNGILSSESERAARQQIKASNLTPLSLGKTNRNHFLRLGSLRNNYFLLLDKLQLCLIQVYPLMKP